MNRRLSPTLISANRAVLAFLLLCGCSRTSDTLHVTGQIEGHPIAVGSKVGGRISEVAAREGQAVKRGDVLFRIESTEAEADLLAAKATLAQAEAQLQKLEAGAREEEIRAAEASAASAKAQYDEALTGARSEEISAARARVDTARALLDEAAAEFKRQSNLFEANIVSFSVKDQASHANEAARGTLQTAEKELDLLVQGTRNERITMAKSAYDGAMAKLDELRNGSRHEDISVAVGTRDYAQAQVKRAEANLAEMTIVSPADGVVETLDLRPGDIVKSGPAARVINPDDLDLTVYVGAALLGHLNVGQPVKFTTDSHGDETFEGTISFIAASGEFTPRNLQTQEDRVQQVFEVKVHTGSAGGKLRAGMAGTVTLPRL